MSCGSTEARYADEMSEEDNLELCLVIEEKVINCPGGVTAPTI
jgi:hypothetical protein